MLLLLLCGSLALPKPAHFCDFLKDVPLLHRGAESSGGHEGEGKKPTRNEEISYTLLYTLHIIALSNIGLRFI